METVIYTPAIIDSTISLPFEQIDANYKHSLIEILKDNIEGKCSAHGYIKPNSIKIITHSSGFLDANKVKYDIKYNCMVCLPFEGMIIECLVVSISTAGIRATLDVAPPSPIVIFITRDHNYNNEEFSNIKENDTITVKIIGQRFELNDENISVLAELSSNN